MRANALWWNLGVVTSIWAAMPCFAASPAPGSAPESPGTSPAPATVEETPSDLYQVWVEGKPVPVYRCRVSAVPLNWVWPGYQRPQDQTEEAAFAGWDMAEAVRVEVVASRPVHRVCVRPLAAGIQPELDVDSRRFSFRIERPGQLVVEVDGPHQALHLFADPMEADPVQPGDPGVRYFGPGVHQPGPMTLADNQTVYLARGAVVHGTITAKDAEYVRVCGRGILDVSRYRRGKAVGGILFDRCRHVQVEGITIRDPAAWTLELDRCDHAEVDWVKLIGLWRYNSDGIDMVSSRNIRVRDCFVRAFDDNIVVKRRTGRPDEAQYPSRNITAQRCVLWNDWNVAVKIGTETAGPEISDVLVQDCHIVRSTHAALGIHVYDGAEVRRVHFDRLFVEVGENEPQPVFQKRKGQAYQPSPEPHVPRLLDLRVHDRHGKGRIEDVRLSNVVVTAPHMPGSRMVGLDASHGIDGVTYENVTLNGRPILNAAAADLITAGHVSNVRFLESKKE